MWYFKELLLIQIIYFLFWILGKGHPKRNLLCPNHDASVMHSPGVRPKTPLRYGTPKKLPIIRDPRTGKGKTLVLNLIQ